MLKDIIAVEPRENYQLNIRFEDGVEGVIDISKIMKVQAFLPLCKIKNTLLRLK